MAFTAETGDHKVTRSDIFLVSPTALVVDVVTFFICRWYFKDAFAQFAAANDISLITLPGDHISMLEQHGAEAAKRVSDFIERA